MTDYDNLDTYNGDTHHDMWVDFDHSVNTDIPDVFNKPDLDNFIDNLNDWD